MIDNPKILFEDDVLIVVDKPSGWITNDSQTVKNNFVLQKWLSEKFNYLLAKSVKMRSGIVHRLDKETSGVIIIAKNENAFFNLQNQFKKRLIEKNYLALVHGKVQPSTGRVDVPVGRLPWSREKFGVLPGGRQAETFYRVISHYKKGNDIFSFLDIKPKTGRTHQIRIHLRYLGYPVVSDQLYAGRKTSKKDRLWCKRLFLHANSVSFIHPSLNELIKIESKLPEELKKVLVSLEKIS